MAARAARPAPRLTPLEIGPPEPKRQPDSPCGQPRRPGVPRSTAASNPLHGNPGCEIPGLRTPPAANPPCETPLTRPSRAGEVRPQDGRQPQRWRRQGETTMPRTAAAVRAPDPAAAGPGGAGTDNSGLQTPLSPASRSPTRPPA